jgi:hypothetical protein
MRVAMVNRVVAHSPLAMQTLKRTRKADHGRGSYRALVAR